MNRYNFIAPIYDTAKQLVYGNALNKAATCYALLYKSSKKILIVGGGSGLELPLLNPEAEVTFIESSSEMIELAKKRNHPVKTTFAHASIFDFELVLGYDLIVFNFVLDLFSPTQVAELLTRIRPCLLPTGKIVVSDFYPVQEQTNVWKKLLLRLTIVFFSITTSLRVKEITNIQECLKQSDYQCISLNHFYSGMVFATVWTKGT